MNDQRVRVPGDVAIKVAIGEVCLQWARLEMTLLALIGHIEPMEMEEIYIIYGGLDILPRVNMALKLARYRKEPSPVVKRIAGVRERLQGGKLLDRRNQVVHGAHRDQEGAETTLTMVRWNGDKRHKRINANEIASLAAEIHELGSEVWEITLSILQREVRDHVQENLSNTL